MNSSSSTQAAEAEALAERLAALCEAMLHESREGQVESLLAQVEERRAVQLRLELLLQGIDPAEGAAARIVQSLTRGAAATRAILPDLQFRLARLGEEISVIRQRTSAIAAYHPTTPSAHGFTRIT